MRFADSEQGIIGISGLIVGKDNKSLVKGFEALDIDFGFDVFSQFCVSFFNGSSGGSTLQLEYVVIVDVIASAGKAVASSC